MGGNSCSCAKQVQFSSSSNHFTFSTVDNALNFPQPPQIEQERFDDTSRQKLNQKFLNTEIIASNNKLSIKTMDAIQNQQNINTIPDKLSKNMFLSNRCLSKNVSDDVFEEISFINQQTEESQKKKKHRKTSIQAKITNNLQQLSKQQTIITQKQILKSLSQYILSQKHMFETARCKKQNLIKFKKLEISKNYKFIEKIGQGTFGNVYKAINKQTGELRAIKVLKKSKSDGSKIMQQLQILKKIDHPYILKIIEAFISQDQFYIVTQYCQGGSLGKYIKQNRAFSDRSLKLIFKKIFNALAYLHKINIVHRDIKLQNILLVNKLDSQKDIQALDIRIIDFGLAKVLSSSKIKDKQKIGTHSYMAPEVMIGIYSTKCDVWSCGILLLNLLTRNNPFKGKTKEQTFHNIQTKQLSFSGWQWKYVDSKAKDLLLKLLNKNNLLRISIRQALNHPWLKIQQDIQGQKHIFQKFTKKLYEYHRGNSLITFIQSFLSFTKTPPDQMIQISKIFELLDKNCDGYIGRQEIQYAFKQSNQQIDDHQKQYILNTIDKNHSGKICYSQLVAILCDKKKLFVKNSMISAFKYIDSDDSGFIQRNELKQLLKSANYKELSSILQELDENNDKKISQQQFITYLQSKLYNN